MHCTLSIQHTFTQVRTMSEGKVRTHADTFGVRNENVAGEITSTVHMMSNTNDNSRTTKKKPISQSVQ